VNIDLSQAWNGGASIPGLEGQHRSGEIAGPATGRLGAWRMVFRRADDFLERRRSRHSASKDKSLAAHVDYGNYCDAAIQG